MEGRTVKIKMTKFHGTLSKQKKDNLKMLSPVCITAVACFMFIAGTVSISNAVPGKGICDQTDTYDKLKCKHDNVATQVEFMANEIFKAGTPLGDQLTPGQRKQLKSVEMKSARAKHKSEANDFKKLAKRELKANKKNCYFIPLTVDDDYEGDGICDYEQGDKNASCAAIELDAEGNLQPCNPEKKNKGKGNEGLECDQNCYTDEASTYEEADEMLEEAAPMGQAYDALETDLYDVNEKLENLNSSPSALLSYNSVSEASNSCETPSTTPGLDIAAGILRQVSVTARGLAGISGTGCDQTAVALGFGGNGSVVCLVFETAASVLEVAYVTTDEILKTEMSALQSSTLECLQQTAGEIDTGFMNLYAQHNNIILNDNDNRDAIITKIEEVRLELINLLSTPLGQRAIFPVK